MDMIPCPCCFESSGYMARVVSATWTDPAYAEPDPMSPCTECRGKGEIVKPVLVTSHVYPPIPVRDYDWIAYVDGDEEAGRYGEGATEAEAIADFMDTYAEHYPGVEAPVNLLDAVREAGVA